MILAARRHSAFLLLFRFLLCAGAICFSADPAHAQSADAPPGASSSNAAKEAPNILLVLADDLGYGSTGAYGADPSLVRTPHIDRLARQGIRFTDANTPSSVCSPTRYAMLMGRYAWRTRLKSGVVGPVAPLLPDPERPSLASWLQGRGYRTAAIGKWHLGYDTENDPGHFTGRLVPGPLEMGFDYHFGVPHNHDDIIGTYVENDRVWQLESERTSRYGRNSYGNPYIGLDAPQRVNKQVMQTLTDKSTDWLKKQDQREEPFFLYFAPVAVHEPITPSDRMRGTTAGGAYTDFIQDLDRSIGRLLKTLDETGMRENTLVIVTSDNGGDLPSDPDEPAIQAQRAGLQVNGTYRGDKHSIWQGGLRVPFVARWPGKIPAGATSDAMVNLVDLFATVTDALSGKVPPPGTAAPDSYSFREALLQEEKPQAPRPPMVQSNVNGIRALRAGQWKYIEGAYPEGEAPAEEDSGAESPQARRQLYNLEVDPREQNDVIEEHPEVAKRLQQRLDEIRAHPDRRASRQRREQ